MLSIRGIYNGESIIPLDKIDFKSSSEVIITFLDFESKLKSEDKVNSNYKNSYPDNYNINSIDNMDKDKKKEYIIGVCDSAAQMYSNNPDLIIEDPIDLIEY